MIVIIYIYIIKTVILDIKTYEINILAVIQIKNKHCTNRR